MKRIRKSLVATAAVVAVFALIAWLAWWRPAHSQRGSRHQHPPNEAMIKEAGKLVRMEVTPKFNYSFDRMKPGVLQHIDRKYTYDVVPPELVNGFLFQGIHRPNAGTGIKFTLLGPAKVYYFFHEFGDGGYSRIFAELPDWKRSESFPQYDIHNGEHGLRMVMYERDADAGTYTIPPTTSDRACFNIVFQPGPDFSTSRSR